VEKVPNFRTGDASADETGQKKEVEAVDPDQIARLIQLEDLLAEHLVYSGVHKPQVLLRLGGNIVQVQRAIHICNMVHDGPQLLLAVNIVELEMHVLRDVHGVAVELRERERDVFLLLGRNGGVLVAHAAHPAGPRVELQRQKVLLVPLGLPVALNEWWMKTIRVRKNVNVYIKRTSVTIRENGTPISEVEIVQMYYLAVSGEEHGQEVGHDDASVVGVDLRHVRPARAAAVPLRVLLRFL